MSSLTRMLSVLDLFEADAARITPAQVQARFGLTRATAYRYLKALVDAGLLARFGGGYVLGPRAVELDLRIRRSDPLLTAAEPVLARLAQVEPCDLQIVALAGSRIIVTHHLSAGAGVTISYGRGATMPMLKGAGGRAILSRLPVARQRALIARARGLDPKDFGDAHWQPLRAVLARIRRQGHAVSQGELDAGSVGIAVPILQEGFGPPSALVRIVAQAQFVEADLAAQVAMLRDAAAAIVAALPAD